MFGLEKVGVALLNRALSSCSEDVWKALDARIARLPVEEQCEQLAREVRSTQKDRRLAARSIGALDSDITTVRALVNDPPRMARFGALLDSYLADSDLRFKEDYNGQDRAAAVRTILHSTQGITHGKASTQEVFPMATMFDVLNRSPLALYQGSNPALHSHYLHGRTSFVTLSFSPQWREALGERAVELSTRFRDQGKPMDLIVIGDGSGLIGGDVAARLAGSGHKFRLIHLDLSAAMLASQREHYISSGINPDSIVSVRGSVLDASSALKTAVPDLKGAFVVAHELFDDLRSHVLQGNSANRVGAILGRLGFNSDKAETVSELHLSIEPDTSKINPHFTLSASHPLIRELPEYLPFYAQAKAATFSPETVGALREILGSCESVALYVGDYADRFKISEDSPAETLLRYHGPGITDETNISQALTRSGTLTADVVPATLYFVEAFGGKVEFLGTQEEFVGKLKPQLAAHPDLWLRSMREKAKKNDFPDVASVIEAQSRLDMYSPRFFAAEITKGIS